jgi:microsomal dipeptidase-like Zn-dependent dipeptidase
MKISLLMLLLLFLSGVVTLTHACSTQWAQSCYDEGPVVGLTEFGKNVVREMNRFYFFEIQKDSERFHHSD